MCLVDFCENMVPGFSPGAEMLLTTSCCGGFAHGHWLPALLSNIHTSKKGEGCAGNLVGPETDLRRLVPNVSSSNIFSERCKKKFKENN